MTVTAAAGSNVDLGSGWATIWGVVTAAVPNLTGILAVFATLVAAFAIGKFLYERRKGSGGNTKELTWMLILAMIIAAPGTIFPILLNIASWVANLIAGFVASLGV